MANSKHKLKECLGKVVKESKKKGLTNNCKKRECMIISKRDSPS